MSKRYALLIGLNYSGVKNENELTGCINDIIDMRNYLLNHRYKTNEIKALMDDQSLTKEGILLHLHDLAIATWKDNLDHVFFQYSGHGRQVKDENDDETDGYDEGIVPLDWNINGTIRDDVLNKFFSSCNPKTKILCIFDCCHSGSILDLQNQKTDQKIVCMSACKDSEIASELHDYKDNGIFTACLLAELAEDSTINFKDLNKNITKRLQDQNYKQKNIISASFNLFTDRFIEFI